VLGRVGLVFVAGTAGLPAGACAAQRVRPSDQEGRRTGCGHLRGGYRLAQSWPRTLYRIADARAALGSRKGSGRSVLPGQFVGVLPPVSHTPVSLLVREDTVLFLSRLLHAKRQRRGSEPGGECWAVSLGLCSFCVGSSTAFVGSSPQTTRSAYRPPTGTCTKALMCAAGGPDLHGALSAAQSRRMQHVSLDGTLIAADRVATPGPTPGVDL
jgi:hypothetical protein